MSKTAFALRLCYCVIASQRFLVYNHARTGTSVVHSCRSVVLSAGIELLIEDFCFSVWQVGTTTGVVAAAGLCSKALLSERNIPFQLVAE